MSPSLQVHPSLVTLVRWVTHVLSVLILFFFAVMFGGELTQGQTPDLKPREILSFAAMAVQLIGILIAFRKEMLCGPCGSTASVDFNLQRDRLIGGPATGETLSVRAGDKTPMSFVTAPCVLLLSLVLPMFASTAGSESTTPAPQTREGKIPFSPAQGQPFPRRYPALDLGFGLCTFSPKLSDLSEVYGHTPSFGLNPMFSASVEIAFSRTFGVLGDAGFSLMGGESGAAQGTVGLVAYLPAFSSRRLRPSLGAGVALCSMNGVDAVSGVDAETITEAGATGWFGRAGVEYPLGASAALDLYGAYCAYPRVSTDTYQAGQPTVSFDLSNVVVGLRYKRLGW